jgi:hypothetical protein
MFEKFINSHPDFKVVERPSSSLLELYRDLLPTDLLVFWEEYGFGTFMNGYLKMVNPESYQGFMTSSYSVFQEPATVFAATAMGDLLIWEKTWVKQINYRKGKGANQGRRITQLFDLYLSSWPNTESALDAKQFLPALETLGECAFDECYAYVPALALGGAEKVENLQKVKLREHMMILSGLVGIIE